VVLLDFDALTRTVECLPPALKDQVLGYARSIGATAPQIFRDAGVNISSMASGRLVFFAGIRKLYSIIESSHWILDNAGAILERQNLYRIQVGGSDFSRNGEYHRELKTLKRGFDRFLHEQGLEEYIEIRCDAELARAIVNER